MKNFIVLFIIIAITAGTVYAQPIREQQGDAAPQVTCEQRGGEEHRQREFQPRAKSEPQHEFQHRQKSGQHRREFNPQSGNDQRPEYQSVAINGTLKLERGFVAVQSASGDSVYIVPMLNRYIGFISGLTEDARVSIEGIQFRNIIHPTKLTIGERAYDFPAFSGFNHGSRTRK